MDGNTNRNSVCEGMDRPGVHLQNVAVMSNGGTRWIAEYASAEAVVFRQCERPHARLAFRRRPTSMCSGG